MLRKIFAIAGRTLAVTLRDRKALILMFLVPMLLIFVLGASLKGLFSNSDGEPAAVTVAVVDDDHGALSRIFADQVLGSAEAKKFFAPTPLADFGAARTAVGNGQYLAVVHFPAGYSADVMQGKAPQIDVVTDAGRPDLAQYVTDIVQMFSQSVLAGKVDAERLGPKAAALLSAPAQPAITASHFGSKPISALAYYAIGMGVLYVLAAGIGQAQTMASGRQIGLLDRMLTTPTAPGVLVAGEFLGAFLLLFVQFGALILGTHFLFGVQWGDPLSVLVVTLAYSFALAGLSAAIAAYVKRAETIGYLINAGWLLGALGGSMSPLYTYPHTLQQVAKITPNTWALLAFQSIMSGSTLAGVATSVWVLLAIGIVLGAAGSLRLASR